MKTAEELILSDVRNLRPDDFDLALKEIKFPDKNDYAYFQIFDSEGNLVATTKYDDRIEDLIYEVDVIYTIKAQIHEDLYQKAYDRSEELFLQIKEKFKEYILHELGLKNNRKGDMLLDIAVSLNDDFRDNTKILNFDFWRICHIAKKILPLVH